MLDELPFKVVNCKSATVNWINGAGWKIENVIIEMYETYYVFRIHGSDPIIFERHSVYWIKYEEKVKVKI